MWCDFPKNKHLKQAIYRGSGGAGDATADATNTSQLALAAAAEAQASATSAASSATSAANSASAAATDAADAAASAAAALLSETYSAETALNASNSADSAADSATAAAASASDASDDAASAATSATNAANSASSASTSASSAATSATNAATSATNASNSATTASTAATNAGNSATAAATSATDAAASASTASTQATNASNSATSAASSATAASSSASSASSSASSASTSATNAASSASSASTSASNAATSETNAANSASAAATSATNAANSASDAADSAALAATFDPALYLTKADPSYTGNLTGTGDLRLNNGNADGAQLQLASSGYSDWNLDNYSGRLRAYYGSTEYFTINASGNVGIGTSTITDAGVTVTQGITRDSDWDAKLALQSTADNDYPVLLLSGCSSASRYGGIAQTASTSGNTANKITAQISFENTSSTAGNIVFATNGNVGTTVASERVRISSSGKVLVGTSTSPASTNSTMVLADSVAGGAGIQVTKTSATTGGGLIGTANGPGLVFYSHTGTVGSESYTERARIDSGGNLLVGSATAVYSTCKINAITSSGTALMASTNYSGDVSTAAMYVSKYDNSTSAIYARFLMNNGASGSGQIQGNGAGAASFAAFSDARIKENIVDLPSQLSNIMALRPVEFDYIESYGGGHQIGFVAQEMQQVFPDSVSEDESEDKILSVTGWSKTEARLVKAIQEQQSIIQTLTARIEALEQA